MRCLFIYALAMSSGVRPSASLALIAPGSAVLSAALRITMFPYLVAQGTRFISGGSVWKKPFKISRETDVTSLGLGSEQVRSR